MTANFAGNIFKIKILLVTLKKDYFKLAVSSVVFLIRQQQNVQRTEIDGQNENNLDLNATSSQDQN